MHSPTRAIIDLPALRHNLSLIERGSGLPVMAVVKANAYGHGVEGISSALADAGVKRFAVATLPEAIALRESGLSQRIQVFGAPRADELEAFSRHGLELTISTTQLLEACLQTRVPLAVQLQLDTGMVRLGLPPEETRTALERITEVPALTLTGVFTHFASADLAGKRQTTEQLAVWREIRAQLPPGMEAHASATGGVFTTPAVKGMSDLVRAGIGLYGLYDPSGDVPDGGLRPVMRLVSRVVRVEAIRRGTPVSYGGRWTAPENGRIITVACGYADGLPRSLSSRGQVGIGGTLYPIAGTVCMDMCMAFAPPNSPGVRVDDEVTLWGTGGPSVLEVARLAGTIPYEIVCGVSQRVARVFTD